MLFLIIYHAHHAYEAGQQCFTGYEDVAVFVIDNNITNLKNTKAMNTEKNNCTADENPKQILNVPQMTNKKIENQSTRHQ